VKEPENLELENAVIKDAKITNDDHGVLTAWIMLEYGAHGGQGFGGYGLYLPKSFTNHTLESLAGHFIWRVMEIAGVSEWSELKGKTIRSRHNFSMVWEIGHIIHDDWFCPGKDFEPIIQKNKMAKEARHVKE
jgi:hypothetical protein